MNRKPVKIIALVGLVVLLVAVWHVAEAKGRKSKKGNKPVLTPVAASAIKKAFPKAKIVKVEREPHVLVIYEVEMIQDGKEVEAEVFVNGEILAVEKPITKTDLPKAVALTLATEAKGAEIKELEQKEIRATIAISRFAKPKTVYEAEWMENGKEIEVKIDANGKLLKREIEDDDDDEDEVEVSIDQVPAAVKATILKHAGKNKIHEIEKETKRGKTIYEAEWKVGDKEIEIKVASDGKLLSKKIDDDDDHDDDEDHDDDDDHDDDEDDDDDDND